MTRKPGCCDGFLRIIDWIPYLIGLMVELEEDYPDFKDLILDYI